jgi:hypothetical protein
MSFDAMPPNQPHALDGGKPRPCQFKRHWSAASDAERSARWVRWFYGETF